MNHANDMPLAFLWARGDRWAVTLEGTRARHRACELVKLLTELVMRAPGEQIEVTPGVWLYVPHTDLGWIDLLTVMADRAQIPARVEVREFEGVRGCHLLMLVECPTETGPIDARVPVSSALACGPCDGRGASWRAIGEHRYQLRCDLCRGSGVVEQPRQITSERTVYASR